MANDLFGETEDSDDAACQACDKSNTKKQSEGERMAERGEEEHQSFVVVEEKQGGIVKS